MRARGWGCCEATHSLQRVKADTAARRRSDPKRACAAASRNPLEGDRCFSLKHLISAPSPGSPDSTTLVTDDVVLEATVFVWRWASTAPRARMIFTPRSRPSFVRVA